MIERLDDRELSYICGRLGIQATGTNLAHMRELMEAMRIFEERNAVRHDLWREDAVEGSAQQCKSKALRLKGHAQALVNDHSPPQARYDEAMDDARDLVNYAIFFARNAQEGNLAPEMALD